MPNKKSRVIIDDDDDDDNERDRETMQAVRSNKANITKENKENIQINTCSEDKVSSLSSAKKPVIEEAIWYCPICTYAIQKDLTICEICGYVT